MRGHSRSAAVLDVSPLSFTCALGWPDIQGQAHLKTALREDHGGLEAGRFARRREMGTLVRKLYRKTLAQAGEKAQGLYVSVPNEYTQVYMRVLELPVYGRIQASDLAELTAMAREAPVPPDYRLLSERPIAWHVDREMVYRSPIGREGKLVKGYYALIYGYNPYCLDLADIVDEAGAALEGFVSVSEALMRYAAKKLNLLGTFVLMDSDALSTYVMAAQRGKLWLMKPFPIGTERLRQDLMQFMPADYEQADRKLRTMRLGPRVGEDSPAARAVEGRLHELLIKAGEELETSGISLSEPIHLVLSGEGWTGLTGAADLAARQVKAKISILTPPPRGASIHSIAMLDQVLSHERPERSWWDEFKKRIIQSNH